MRTEILNVGFDTYTMGEAVNRFLSFLEEDNKHANILITPNPEIVMEANKDKEFFEIIKNAELVIPDGIGVVYASKFNKVKLRERVAGYDLIQNVFYHIKEKNYSVYFLGGAPKVAELAKKKMEEKYKGLKIVGVHDGYFDSSEEEKIIKEINELSPDILLVGLGFPKQEKWAENHRDILNVKAMACIGGSFDAMAGTFKRAPDIFIKLGLEWFYRLIKQPSRITRMYKLPIFMLVVIKEKIKNVFVKSDKEFSSNGK